MTRPISENALIGTFLLGIGVFAAIGWAWKMALDNSQSEIDVDFDELKRNERK